MNIIKLKIILISSIHYYVSFKHLFNNFGIFIFFFTNFFLFFSSSRKLRSSTLKKSSNNNNNNTIDNNIKLKRKRKMSSKSRSTRKDSSKIEKKKTIPSVDTSSESCDSNEDSFQSAESPFDPLARRTETSLSSSASQAFSKKMPTKTAPPHPADNRHTSTNNNSSVPKQPPTTDTDSQAPNDPERQRVRFFLEK